MEVLLTVLRKHMNLTLGGERFIVVFDINVTYIIHITHTLYFLV